jgi:tRNA (guanine-N7-)-methyltransferase
MDGSGDEDHLHDHVRKRSIRSFVKRTGRLTRSQQHALEHYQSLYGLEFQAQSALDFKHMFAHSNCVKLEIGFGNGDSLVEMAQKDAGCNYIGIEVHDPGVGHCLNRIHEEGINNLKLISHDAIEVLQHMIPAGTLDAVFLFFPDPWHKKRHHKRRIVNQQFRDLLIQTMKPGAVLHMATDWLEYAQHMAQDLFSDPRFENMGNDQGFSPTPEYRPQTKFERRGMRLGHGVWDLLFRKRE